MRNNEINLRVPRVVKGLKFRHLYTLIMLAVTAFFVWHVVDLLVLTPRAQTGTTPMGYRMAEIEPLEEFWLREVEDFGATVEGIDYVEVFWNGGPVVYLSVRVEPGTSLHDAQRVALPVVEYFINASSEIALQYNLQIVLSSGIIAERDEIGNVISGVLYENQAAVIAHFHAYRASFAERVLAHAEIYPSIANVERATININATLNRSILETWGEEGLAELRERLAAIEVIGIPDIDYENLDGDDDEVPDYDAEDEDYIPVYPGFLQIEQSNISDFPIWGAWCNQRSRIIWSSQGPERPQTAPDVDDIDVDAEEIY